MSRPPLYYIIVVTHQSLKISNMSSACCNHARRFPYTNTRKVRVCRWCHMTGCLDTSWITNTSRFLMGIQLINANQQLYDNFLYYLCCIWIKHVFYEKHQYFQQTFMDKFNAIYCWDASHQSDNSTERIHWAEIKTPAKLLTPQTHFKITL